MARVNNDGLKAIAGLLERYGFMPLMLAASKIAKRMADTCEPQLSREWTYNSNRLRKLVLRPKRNRAGGRTPIHSRIGFSRPMAKAMDSFTQQDLWAIELLIGSLGLRGFVWFAAKMNDDCRTAKRFRDLSNTLPI